MKLQVDYDDMIEIKQDIKGIEVILVHLESSEYFKGLRKIGLCSGQSEKV